MPAKKKPSKESSTPSKKKGRPPGSKNKPKTPKAKPQGEPSLKTVDVSTQLITAEADTPKTTPKSTPKKTPKTTPKSTPKTTPSDIPIKTILKPPPIKSRRPSIVSKMEELSPADSLLDTIRTCCSEPAPGINLDVSGKSSSVGSRVYHAKAEGYLDGGDVWKTAESALRPHTKQTDLSQNMKKKPFALTTTTPIPDMPGFTDTRTRVLVPGDNYPSIYDDRRGNPGSLMEERHILYPDTTWWMSQNFGEGSLRNLCMPATKTREAKSILKQTSDIYHLKHNI